MKKNLIMEIIFLSLFSFVISVHADVVVSDFQYKSYKGHYSDGGYAYNPQTGEWADTSNADSFSSRDRLEATASGISELIIVSSTALLLRGKMLEDIAGQCSDDECVADALIQYNDILNIDGIGKVMSLDLEGGDEIIIDAYNLGNNPIVVVTQVNSDGVSNVLGSVFFEDLSESTIKYDEIMLTPKDPLEGDPKQGYLPSLTQAFNMESESGSPKCWIFTIPGMDGKDDMEGWLFEKTEDLYNELTASGWVMQREVELVNLDYDTAATINLDNAGSSTADVASEIFQYINPGDFVVISSISLGALLAIEMLHNEVYGPGLRDLTEILVAGEFEAPLAGGLLNFEHWTDYFPLIEAYWSGAFNYTPPVFKDLFVDSDVMERARASFPYEHELSGLHEFRVNRKDPETQLPYDWRLSGMDLDPPTFSHNAWNPDYDAINPHNAVARAEYFEKLRPSLMHCMGYQPPFDICVQSPTSGLCTGQPIKKVGNYTGPTDSVPQGGGGNIGNVGPATPPHQPCGQTAPMCGGWCPAADEKCVDNNGQCECEKEEDPPEPCHALGGAGQCGGFCFNGKVCVDTHPYEGVTTCECVWVHEEPKDVVEEEIMSFERSN